MTDHTFIPGKDAALEDSIERFQTKLQALGFDIEEASWLNPVPNVWSVHIRDKECALCFTNGKGASKTAATTMSPRPRRTTGVAPSLSTSQPAGMPVRAASRGPPDIIRPTVPRLRPKTPLR